MTAAATAARAAAAGGWPCSPSLQRASGPHRASVLPVSASAQTTIRGHAPGPALPLPRPDRSSSRSSTRMRSRQPLSSSLARRSNSSRSLSPKRGCSRALPLSAAAAGSARYCRRMVDSCERNVCRWWCCEAASDQGGSVRDQPRAPTPNESQIGKSDTHDLVGLLEERVLLAPRLVGCGGGLPAVDPAADGVDVGARLAPVQAAAAAAGRGPAARGRP